MYYRKIFLHCILCTIKMFRVGGLKPAQPESTALWKNLNLIQFNPNLDPGGQLNPTQPNMGLCHWNRGCHKLSCKQKNLQNKILLNLISFHLWKPSCSNKTSLCHVFLAPQGVVSKFIIEKSRSGRFLWNMNWDLGWIWLNGQLSCLQSFRIFWPMKPSYTYKWNNTICGTCIKNIYFL